MAVYPVRVGESMAFAVLHEVRHGQMKAVVLLSGGIDSTVALAAAVSAGHGCSALTFSYGQTHRREVYSAVAVASHYGVKHQTLELPPVFGASALLGSEPIPTGHAQRPDATEVPGRNLVFLSTAAAIADAEGAGMIVFGGNADDAGGYPDCRPDFVLSLRDAVAEGTKNHIWLHAPFLDQTKREIVHIGRALDVPFGLTWSCYRSGEHPCGVCGACESRQEAMA